MKKQRKKKRRKERSFEDSMSEQCPRCGISQMIKEGETKEEATIDLFKRHDQENCDHMIEINKEMELSKITPCPKCGTLGSPYACDCLWTKPVRKVKHQDKITIPSTKKRIKKKVAATE